MKTIVIQGASGTWTRQQMDLLLKLITMRIFKTLIESVKSVSLVVNIDESCFPLNEHIIIADLLSINSNMGN